jgi:surface antigen
VLAVVLALSGYASVSNQLPSALFLRLGAINAQGLVMGQGGDVNGVNLGRMDTIVAPLALPTSAPVSHTPIAYVVGKGETVASIATKFRVTQDQVLWSNPGLIGTQTVTAGERILVPPVPGVVVLVGKSDTLAALAAKYHVNAQAIIDFNYLRTDALTAGVALVLPGGRGAAIPVPSTGNGSSSNASGYAVGGNPAYASNGQWPYGYCTWYVATRRHVTWTGNAWQWWPNARAQGYPEGQTPKVGAIMVTWESSYGHVAYVEQVNSDGSWVVSEMNFVAWGVVDHRTIRPGQVPLIGFIY